jgi:hypothetical protein
MCPAGTSHDVSSSVPAFMLISGEPSVPCQIRTPQSRQKPSLAFLAGFTHAADTDQSRINFHVFAPEAQAFAEGRGGVPLAFRAMAEIEHQRSGQHPVANAAALAPTGQRQGWYGGFLHGLNLLDETG